MIRALNEADLPKIKKVIDSSELFPSELLDEMVSGYLGKTEDCIWLTNDGNQAVFVAYAAPEKMTEGTWNLYLIAVHNKHQEKGIGSKVMRHIEESLREKGVRILLVETSGLDDFENTRAFYTKKGYTLEARVRDFYQKGEDKIIYWKRLN